MYNVLITADRDAWETSQLMSAPLDRFKEYSGGPEAAHIQLEDPSSLRRLEGIPTLLAYETGAATGESDVIRYGKLSRIAVDRRNLIFAFQEEGRFSRADFAEFAGRLFISDWEARRTHWAVKEGGIPREMMARLQRTYDLVLSFAGEERAYVEKVAQSLRKKGVRVFYDSYEEVSLWGRDLAEHFEAVYRRSGRHCVMFISENYAQKMWTIHERRSALVRALQDRADYILPARFDDTEVPGIRPTVAYVDLRHKKPAQLAVMLEQKLGLP